MIKKEYAYQKPSAEGLAKITFLREEFSALDATIRANTPASREQSLALTKLEEMAMWAIKAVVHNEPAST